MKTLFIDIETSPLDVDVWNLFNQNVNINQVNAPTRMLCFAGKWADQKKPFFIDERETSDRGHMVAEAWMSLNTADAVVTWNGDHFDLPHLNREFLQTGFTPPAPYKSIDLMKMVRKKFKFPSNKLQYISKALGFDGKIEHTGHRLWKDCMAGDETAWKLMKKYNIQDVVLLEQIFNHLQSWVDLPNQNLYSDGGVCPHCGQSEDLMKQGFAYTSTGKYQRYLCVGETCGKWSRATQREHGVKLQGV